MIWARRWSRYAATAASAPWQAAKVAGHWFRVLTTGEDNKTPVAVSAMAVFFATIIGAMMVQFMVLAGYAFRRGEAFEATSYGTGAAALGAIGVSAIGMLGKAMQWISRGQVERDAEAEALGFMPGAGAADQSDVISTVGATTTEEHTT